MNTNNHIYAVILAGGGGTRLWPKSRENTPKQFLKLVGTDTMLQLTATRISKLVPWERIIVVTNEKYIDQVKTQLPEINSTHIIAEPAKKDTALAMIVGALFAQKLDPEAVIINCASDHTLEDEAEFIRVMKVASNTAFNQDVLVSVGIRPTRPATGFGYIRIGDEFSRTSSNLPVFNVENFTEKPNKATAQAFIATGRYFWNANMYVWKSSTLLEACKKHFAEIIPHLQPIINNDVKSFHAKLEEVYAQAPSISIDYAISEKADNLVLIPGDFGWDDVGDWKVVYQLGQKNLDNNVVISDGKVKKALAIQSRNNLVYTDSRLVAMYGVDDMIVVDTDEILLIIPQQYSQDVKKIVERLKEEKKNEYL